MARDDYASRITADILKTCKNGCTKRENNGANPSFTRSARRITAEIVDKGLLRYIEHQQVYITTDKGYMFLDSRDYSQGMKGRSDG